MPLYDSLQNQGEYFASHYFAEQLAEDLKKGLFKDWTSRETDPVDGPHRVTPRTSLPTLRGQYFTAEARTLFAERASLEEKEGESAYTFGDPEWCAQLISWHRKVLAALGFDASAESGEASAPGPREITVHRAGRDITAQVAYYGDDIVALDCGWTDTFDGALAKDGAARLLYPLRATAAEQYLDGAALASFLLHADEINGMAKPLRFVLLLLGGIVLLADRRSFGEGRYIAANLDAALSRGDTAKTGELATIAALLCRETLEPRENGEGPALDDLLTSSTQNASGVTDELRDGLRTSVELIANEVLRRLDEQGVSPDQIADPRTFARQLTRESLRYLYRILFLLYAESRPELGILPADDGAYEAGYSILRLRELVQRDARLTGERARKGTHLYESLELLFQLVNQGHRAHGTEPDDDLPGDSSEVRAAKAARRSEDRGLRFEQLNSTLFDDTAITLIGQGIMHPDADEDDPDAPRLDTRLRNDTLHRVLRALTLTAGSRKQRGGFISYRNLGINQLGAVYEGLMSYTGSIATEKLYEVAKKGDPTDGSWMVPASRIDQYPDEVFVHYPAGDPDGRGGLRKTYEKGQFVYRLSGRDRQTSASYYTPESLTKLTVELTLRERLDQDKDEDGNVRSRTRAAAILKYKICEPALGSGAFLNEAINQVAAEYLKRRQEELGVSIPASEYLTELQRAKAYIALHNCYGVDLNATAVELAEVSLWLNTMHPGMRAPWFGLHLRRGNSLIGARHAVYAAKNVAGREWFAGKNTLAPMELPLTFRGEPGREQELELPDGAVHQFLLPAHGWAAVAGEAEVKKLDPAQAKQLGDWRKGMLKTPSKTQVTRLQGVARRAEYLWGLVVKRIELSEKQIARKIDVWGTCDPSGQPHEEYAFLERPDEAIAREKIYADLFDAVDTPYWRLKTVMDAWCALWFWPIDKAGLLDGTDGVYDEVSSAHVVREFMAASPRDWAVVEQGALFGEVQGTIMSVMDSGEEFLTTLTAGPKRSGGGRGAKPTPSRRRVIPLKDLADWLDFAEALLGTADIDPDSLVGDFPSLEKLSEYELDIPGYMGMDSSYEIQGRFPWLDAVVDIAEEQGFFHWQLEFAYTFASNGGFDLQVGNPPWVRPEWKEDLVLAERDPWFALADDATTVARTHRRAELLSHESAYGYWFGEMTANRALVESLASPHNYRLLAGFHPDFYRCFMVRTWAHASGNGTVGLVHPGTHFTGDKEALLREEAYHRLRIHGDFVNSGNRFFPPPVGRATHFGVHIYGSPGEISFDNLSWLFSADALRQSAHHDGSGETPGVKYKGDWDARPHRTRVFRVTNDVLAIWQRLAGDEGKPVSQAKLLAPVSTAEAPAIAALADYPVRLGHYHPQISRGFDESGARKDGLIEMSGRGSNQPTDWSEVILKGPQIGSATPIFKSYTARSGDLPMDLTAIADDFVPDSAYTRACDSADYRAAHDRWTDFEKLKELVSDAVLRDEVRTQLAADNNLDEADISDDKIDDYLTEQARIAYTDFYRVIWRGMIAPNTERSLFAALMRPGPAHVHSLRSMILRSRTQTADLAGFWASLPIDYFLRTIGIVYLDVSHARRMPAPADGSPLALALRLRSMRLNCLTSAYGDLWRDLFAESWTDEAWACEWPNLAPLGDVEAVWRHATPLRTDYARRAAFVELDALVAVMLGVDADALIAMYRSRFPVMIGFESAMWFDVAGRRISADRYAYGAGQTAADFEQFQEHLKNPDEVSPPAGYTAPFYQADREREMREAHAVFQARLDAAIADGKWDPVKQEVPSS